MWIITKNGMVINSDYISMMVAENNLTYAYLNGEKSIRYSLGYGDLRQTFLDNIASGAKILSFKEGD